MYLLYVYIIAIYNLFVYKIYKTNYLFTKIIHNLKSFLGANLLSAKPLNLDSFVKFPKILFWCRVIDKLESIFSKILLCIVKQYSKHFDNASKKFF